MPRHSTNSLPFNTQAVLAARPIDGKQTEYTIVGARGLKLVVLPTGTATYMFAYTANVAGATVRNKIKVGRRDGISLHDARRKVDQYRRQIDGGIDPAAEHERVKQAALARANAMTLRQLFADRLSKDDARAKQTMDGYAEAMQRDVFPELGDMPAAEITADQIARVLEVVEQRSKWQAHKARSCLGSTYRWAMKRRIGGVRVNPVKGLGFTHKGRPRERLPTSDEMATIWKALDAGSLSAPMKLIVKLAILTGQRMGQVVGARLTELERLDTQNPMWRIPGERMKRKQRDQVLPLSKEAAALFAQAVALASERAPDMGFVFPADLDRVSKKVAKKPRTPHINRESASRAMDRLCDELGIKGLVLHDMRKGVTTYLRETHHTPSDVIDLILHHSPRGVTGSHYDFSTLDGPVRKAMQQWSDHIARITEAASAM